MSESMWRAIEAEHSAMTAWRRDLHAHPELAFEETRTAARVAEALEQAGLEVIRGLGRTGVVGVLRGRPGARAVGLRADMDALPMTEHNQFPHASQHPGRMHACGHDGHTAMLLTAARVMARERDVDGTVYFVFQPAEEAGGGAREMIRDGLFERCPMDAIFGMHNWPGLPAGDIAVRAGPCFASSNEFSITLTGRGCHAAMPHLGIDPIPVACQLVQAFQGIISRQLHPLESGVVSVTMMQAGEVINVIPETVKLRGTVRSFTLDTLDMIETRMREITQGICSTFGAQATFDFQRRYPPTVNHTAEAEQVRCVAAELLGAQRVHDFVPTMGAEDFSFYLLEKPGAYFVIGNGDGDHRSVGHGLGPCTLHNPAYDFNDALIPTGAAVWLQLARRFLAG